MLKRSWRKEEKKKSISLENVKRIQIHLVLFRQKIMKFEPLFN